jgi:hypothetical protein
MLNNWQFVSGNTNEVDIQYFQRLNLSEKCELLYELLEQNAFRSVHLIILHAGKTQTHK